MTIKAEEIVFTGERTAALSSRQFVDPVGSEVLIRNRLSIISPGTEGIVFSRLFSPGTHWDAWVRYPFYPGYASIGVVEKCGPDVVSLHPGDRVAHRSTHASHSLVDESRCCSIPDDVADDDAIFFAFAKITAMGARVAGYRLGSRVAVIGAGVIGHFSARWALAAGADRVAMVDAAATKLTALPGGVIPVIGRLDDSVREKIREIFDGELPEIVLDSTGNPAVFPEVLHTAAKFGRVVLLGDTGYPERQHLTSDVITAGLTIVGAHDPHESPEWNTRSITRLFFRMLIDGRMKTSGLITHRFSFSNPQQIYQTCIAERDRLLGAIIDWNREA